MRFAPEIQPRMTEEAAKVMQNAKDREGRILTKTEVRQVRNTPGSLQKLAVKFGMGRQYLEGIRRGTFRKF